IMLKTPETGTRLRGRIERVFAWAAAHQYFTGTNPASREVLRDALPAKPKVEHHKAMPYAELPDFIAELRARDSGSRPALWSTIVAAARTSGVMGARWSEINFGGSGASPQSTWTIPAERMKAGKEHTVPLSDRAVTILKLIPVEAPFPSDFIFING